MESENSSYCRQCGNKLQESFLQDGLCRQCRSSASTIEALAAADGPSGRNQVFPDSSSNRNLPDRIGPYKILDFLGEGGMGAVYLAEQEQPIRRKVALKVIKLGMDTKEVIARFESERQALAMMNHPNISHVYDAGTTERGAPYFVMEHVAGIPIVDYCDRHRLNTRERLELFIHVCQAIQHAHQKGIIHRDIKPSNVLVAVQDGKPVPKIIDFGVAKATNQRSRCWSKDTRLCVQSAAKDVRKRVTPRLVSSLSTKHGASLKRLMNIRQNYRPGEQSIELKQIGLASPEELREAGQKFRIAIVQKRDNKMATRRFGR